MEKLEREKNVYEVYEEHKEAIVYSLEEISGHRNELKNLVLAIIKKLSGPTTDGDISAQKIGGVYEKDHIMMSLKAQKNISPYEKKDIWKTEIYSRLFPEDHRISMIMVDNEHKKSISYQDKRDLKIEFCSDQDRKTLQITGPLELVFPGGESVNSIWQTEDFGLKPNQIEIIKKALKDQPDTRMISIKIVYDKQAHTTQTESFSPEIELVYLRDKSKMFKKYQQVVRISNQGMESIESKTQLDSTKIAIQPQFDKPSDILLDENSLEPKRN